MKVVVKVPSLAALHALAAQVASGSVFLARDLGLAQFATLEVDVETPDDERFSLSCEVLQAFPGTATALTVKPVAREAVDALLSWTMKQTATGDAAAPLVIAIDDDEPEAAPPGDVSVAHQVGEMSISEKRQAALHGIPPVRRPA